MGLSINEIKKVIDEPKEIENILVSKEKEILDIIKEEEYKLLRLRSYISNLKGDKGMKNIIIKSLPKVKVASMRRIVNSYNEFLEDNFRLL